MQQFSITIFYTASPVQFQQIFTLELSDNLKLKASIALLIQSAARNQNLLTKL